MSEQKNSSNSILVLDLIRVIALLEVLLLHATEVYLKHMRIPPSKNLAALLVMTTVTRTAVPLFVIISGYLHFLPGKSEEAVKPFLQKKFDRLKPAIAWLLIYLAFASKGMVTAASALEAVISGKVFIHFWYIYLMVGLYLVTPILRKFTKNASDALLNYFIVLWLAFSTIDYIGTIFPYTLGIKTLVAVGWTGYYIFGHWLYRFHLSLPNQPLSVKRNLMLGAAGIIVVSVAGLSIQGFDRFVQMHGFSADYLTPFGVLLLGMSLPLAALFLLLDDRMRLENRFSRRSVALLESINEHSFSIYLAHMLVLKALAMFPWVNYKPIALSALALAALTFLLTWLLVAVLHRIRFLRDWL